MTNNKISTVNSNKSMDRYQMEMNVNQWQTLSLEIYNELKKWDIIGLFELGEKPSWFVFQIKFCPKYKLSVSAVSGTIETTLVDTIDGRLSHCDDLGYDRLRCTKQFADISELKEELMRLHKLTN